MELSQNLANLPPYSRKADFKALAEACEDFRKVWEKTGGYLDFQDPETSKALLKAQLQVDFGLRVNPPDDRLCPPVPNRFNYVAWIQGLIDSTGPNYAGVYEPDRKVVGLDIGTGASAIYTLLCLKTRPNWTMCVTDIDKKSLDSAAHNLAINNLLTRTKLLQTTKENDLIPLRYLGVDKLDFTICNPPFFADEAEMRNSTTGEGKNMKPNAVCTGTKTEMVFPGGDFGFVKKIFEESLVLKEKVSWYSSMLGKLDSAKAIISLLKEHGISNWAVGCLEPGDVTKRWVVAWSFGDYRPRPDIARIDNIAHEFLPFPTRYTIPLSPEHALGLIGHTITSQLSALDLRWVWNPDSLTGIGQASRNVWNRKYRRDYEMRMNEEGGGAVAADSVQDGEKVALVFKIRVVDEPNEIVIDWLRGVDVVLWESFCGMVHRKFKAT